MNQGRKRPSPSAPATEVEGGGAELKAAFELRYTQDAVGDSKSLDGNVRKQLRKVLEKKLAADPEGYGLALRGLLAGYWKHEFAMHRTIYRIYHEHRTVAVCAVGPRKRGNAEDVYRQLEAAVRMGRLAAQVASVLGNILRKEK